MVFIDLIIKVFDKIIRPSGLIAQFLLLILTIAIGLIVYSGLHNYIKDFLGGPSMSFNIGHVHISLYDILKGFLIGIASFWFVRLIILYVEGMVKRSTSLRQSTKGLIIKFVEIFMYGIALIVILNFMGINLTSLAALSGGIGIGIGFGLRNIGSNFISGIILLSEKSAIPDDVIEFGNGNVGFIRKTYARYTLVECFDGKELMIPNDEFMTNTVTNWTHTNRNARVDVEIPISYKNDLQKVVEIVLECTENYKDAYNVIPPRCIIHEFNNAYVKLLLQFWVKDIGVGSVVPRSELMHIILGKFAEHSIKIPYNSLDVYVKNLDLGDNQKVNLDVDSVDKSDDSANKDSVNKSDKVANKLSEANKSNP